MKGSTGSLILTFALFLIIFTIVTSVLSAGSVDPWFVLSFAGDTIGDITQVPYPVSGSPSAGGGMMGFNPYVPDIGVSIAVMLAYAIVALVLSYLLFQRREMTA